MAKCVKKESEEYDTVFGSGILHKLQEFYIITCSWYTVTTSYVCLLHKSETEGKNVSIC